MKKILFAVSEAVPPIKTGGLAGVVGSLPKCFDREYFGVRVIILKYLYIRREWRDKMEYVDRFYVDYLGQSRYVGILQYAHESMTFYFIGNENYFSGAKLYGDWYRGLEKFCFFCRATLSTLPVIGFRPDVVHCHDWQTRLIPVLLKDESHEGESFRSMKSVITIHNLKFQGVRGVRTVKHFTELPGYYPAPDKLEAYKNGSLLKGGIIYADATTMVSSTYTEETKSPLYGEGLDDLMYSKAGSLRGIVNGVGYDEFNLGTNTYTVQTYNAKNFRKEKVKDRKALQQELGLPVNEKTFIVGIVSRLTDQKGFDLIQCVMDELCNDDLQLVILGTGGERYENMSRHHGWKYHDWVSAQIYYSEAMPHKIYVASDTLLMSPLFEPCGLSQLVALRCGTVPIVKETGGLKDTVEPHNEYESMGIGFSFVNYNAHEMLGSIRYVKYVYNNKRQEWNKIIDRAVAEDYS